MSAPRRPIEERFHDHVTPAGPDECWEWQGCVTADGYGILRVGGKRGASEMAHRVSHRIAKGDAGELCVLHTCDNPPCVNPAHLWAGTQIENVQDMVRKGRHVPPAARPGESNPNARLTDAQAEEIRQLDAQGWGPTDIGRAYGVSRETVRDIRHGRRKVAK